MHVAQTSSDTSRRLKKTSRILIESGILYTVSSALNLIFTADDNLHNKYVYLGCVLDTFVCFPLLSALIYDAQLNIL